MLYYLIIIAGDITKESMEGYLKLIGAEKRGKVKEEQFERLMRLLDSNVENDDAGNAIEDLNRKLKYYQSKLLPKSN